MSKILVVNFGSSSLKYKLFDEEEDVMTGLIDIKKKTHRVNGISDTINSVTPEELFKIVIDALEKNGVAVSEIKTIVHRVVHGGVKFTQPTLLSGDVIAELEKLNGLAPLHNPMNIAGIKAAMKVFPRARQIAVFDTAFHATIPEYANTYGIPYDMTRAGIRRYGFHGNSHEYVALKAAENLGKSMENLNVITIHAGNGISITCIKGGESIDTSMGMTPLAGPIMGTRCGDIDPGIVLKLVEDLGIENSTKVLNKGCGLQGLSGVSSDYREVEEVAIAGNKRCQLALDVLYYQVRKYVGAYLAVLEYDVDVIVFTGGIGENSANFRSAVLSGFHKIGIKVSSEANGDVKKCVENIGKGDVPVLVIKTNEELMMSKKAKKG